jgi:hypothetical protein
MKWRATGLGVAAAVLVLAVGALGFALISRVGDSGTRTIVTTNTPAVVTTVSSSAVVATPPPTAKPAPVPRTRSVVKPSCETDGDPTGSDTPGCGSGDNEAGDSNSGDSAGDDQAGDGKAGGA